MRVLIVHTNFPGQFVHVAKALADDPRHEVLGVGDARNLKGRPEVHPRIRRIAYESPRGAGADIHAYLRDYENHVRRGQAVLRLLLQLKASGWSPDLILAHPGWGEGLFLKEAFPEARVIQYFEYYYGSPGGDVAFDPEFAATLDDFARVRIKNSTQLVSLMASDLGVSPTQWQKSCFPAILHERLQVAHEGVDTAVVRPDPLAWVKVKDHTFRLGDELVTYVARNLEPYRGFHAFMRALPRLQALRPKAHVVIVGGDGVSYGRRPPEGMTYRQIYCTEMADRVDWSRVHFAGKLPYRDYLRLLQVSAAHVYLTVPFVLSWSMLEAMAAGCVIVGSATAPVQEVITHGENGLLTDFFDPDAIARTVAQAIEEQPVGLREAARRTVVERYDLRERCLPAWMGLLGMPSR
jgi:glycosyltransferase involved in cell wall biosynthesis